MSYKRLKLKLRVFLAGHIVAMVTCCATKLTATCSPMIGQFVDTMIVQLTDKGLSHQTLILGKYWKLFPATLRIVRKRCFDLTELSALRQLDALGASFGERIISFGRAETNHDKVAFQNNSPQSDEASNSHCT